MLDQVRYRLRALLPPRELLARLRWFFLLFGLFFVVTFVPQMVGASRRPWPVVLLSSVLVLGLGAWWLRCYRREHFPAVGLVLECAAFAACILTPHDPFSGFGLLYIAVNFRSLYGKFRQVVLFTTLAVATFVGAAVLAPHLGSVDRLWVLGYQLPGVLPLAVIANLIAVASGRATRAAARERLLSRAGLAVAEASTADETREVALAAVADLLSDVPGAEASFGAGGDLATAGHVLELPVRADGGEHLRIVSPKPLPAEIGDALSIAAAQLRLALTNADLTEDLQRRAGYDALTGLANRRTTDTRLSAAMPAAPGTIGVIMIDLDGFKQVNDTLGHEAGDVLLTAVAERLNRACRGTDLVARLGGDEFMIVLEPMTDPAHVTTTAQRLLEAIQQPIEIYGELVTVGASIGLTINEDGDSRAALLRRADDLMYEAKRGGKNRIRA